MADEKRYNYEYFKNAFQKIKEEFSEKKGLEVRFDQLCNLFSNMMEKLREKLEKMSVSIEKFTQEVRENANPMYQVMKDVNVEIAKTVAEMVDSPEYSIDQAMAAMTRAEENIMSWDNESQRRELTADFISTFSQNTKSLEGYLLAEDLIRKFREMEKERKQGKEFSRSTASKNFDQKTESKSENQEEKKTFDQSVGNEKQESDKEKARPTEKVENAKIPRTSKSKPEKKPQKEPRDRTSEKTKNAVNKSPEQKRNPSFDRSFSEVKVDSPNVPNQSLSQPEMKLEKEEATELPFEDYKVNPIEQSIEVLYKGQSKEERRIQSSDKNAEEQISLLHPSSNLSEAAELPFELNEDTSFGQALGDLIPKEFNSDLDKTARALADKFDSGPDGGVAFLEWCIGKSIEEIQEMANKVDDNIQSPAGSRDLFDAISDGKLDVHIKSEVDFEFER